MLYIAVLTLLYSLSTNAMEIDQHAISCPRSLGNISVFHDENGFNIEDEDGTHLVQPCYLSKELRNIKKEQLSKMIENGAYIKVKKQSNDEYNIEADGRVKGGGPATGAFVYWLCKAAGYGVPVVVGTTMIGNAVTAATATEGSRSVGLAATIGSASSQTSGTASAATATAVTIPTSIAGTAGLPVVGFTTAAPGAATLSAAQNAGLEAAFNAPYLAANPAVSNAAAAAAGAAPFAEAGFNVGMAGAAVGKAVVATIGLEAAGAVVAGVTTAATGTGGYVAAVEGTATGLGTLFSLIPFLP